MSINWLVFAYEGMDMGEREKMKVVINGGKIGKAPFLFAEMKKIDNRLSN